MTKVEASLTILIRCISRCVDCGEEFNDIDPSKTRYLAKRHTELTGHNTIVETESAIRYEREKK